MSEGRGRSGGRGRGRSGRSGSGNRGSGNRGNRGGRSARNAAEDALPYRVLCLHGNEQTGSIFTQRLAPLVARSGGGLAFIDAPHALPLRDGQAASLGWWRPDGAGFAESLRAVESAWRAAAEGGAPFGGLLGFSSGGALAAAAAARPAAFPGLEACVIAAAPRRFEAAGAPACRVLAVIGSADALVAPGDTLAALPGAEVYAHDKGHCLPCRARDVDAYIAFFRRAPAAAATSPAPAPALPRPPPPAVAVAVAARRAPAEAEAEVDAETRAARAEELEALDAIYGDDFEARGGAACAVRLARGDRRGDVFLVAKMRRGYPAPGGDVAFSLETRLSLADFPSRASAALTRAASRAVADALRAGEPCLLDAVQAANGVADGGGGGEEDGGDDDASSAAGAADDAASDGGGAGDAGDEDLTRATSAEIAEYRAFAAAALAAGPAPPPAASARKRGEWELVVGVVGKPSVGKSTFFNAVTRATGALAAKVAAYPFTTIDPNVREGLFACGDPPPEAEVGVAPAAGLAHGRDAAGRRLLPVLLKDVAGLVPGASAGLGRGNKFLNDLLDADALVHVVDAAAETDDAGAASDDREAGAAPLLSEIRWVRDELHRWIAGNVAAKWHSVRRLARVDADSALERLLGLFNGYHATNALTRRALGVAALETADLRTWGRAELHRLVAAFLEVRFPTVVALNKCDRPGAAARVAALLANPPPDLDAVACSAATEAVLVAGRAAGAVAYDDGAAALTAAAAPGDDAALAAAKAYLEERGATGTLTTISRAVARARPAFAYPVRDLDTLAGPLSGVTLGDCLVLRRGGTVDDLYLALAKRGAAGDFVRADAVSGDRRRQAKRTDAIAVDCRVLRIATNKKEPWQRRGGA